MVCGLAINNTYTGIRIFFLFFMPVVTSNVPHHRGRGKSETSVLENLIIIILASCSQGTSEPFWVRTPTWWKPSINHLNTDLQWLNETPENKNQVHLF